MDESSHRHSGRATLSANVMTAASVQAQRRGPLGRHRHQHQLVAGQPLQLVQSVQRAARVPLPALPPLPAGARPQGRAVLPRHEAVSRHRADPPARQPRHQAVQAQPRRLRLVSGHRQPLCRCCFPRKRHLGLRDVTHGNYYLPYYSTGRCYKKNV